MSQASQLSIIIRAIMGEGGGRAEEASPREGAGSQICPDHKAPFNFFWERRRARRRATHTEKKYPPATNECQQQCQQS